MRIISKYILLLSFVIILISYGYFGLNGINWGPANSDEYRLMMSIQQSANSGILMPMWYNYPSLTYLLTLISTSIFIIINHYDLIINFSSSDEIKFFLKEILEWPTKTNPVQGNHSLLYFVRSVFFSTTLIIPICLYLSCRILEIRSNISLLAAILSLSSFVILYHARWIAPDTLVLVMSSIVITFFLWVKKYSDLNNIIILSFLVGIATSAKYPAGLLLILPLIIVNNKKYSIKESIIILISFTSAFIFITPGSILDPVSFFRDVNFEIDHYKALGHAEHTVEPGLQHLVLNLKFIIFKCLSFNKFISVFLFCLSILGSLFLFQNNKIAFVLLFVIPFLYLIYFSSQMVMIVRNLLFLIPFLIILVCYCLENFMLRFKDIKTEILFSFLIFIFVLFTSHKYYDTTKTLNIDDSLYKKQLNNYILNNQEKSIAITKHLSNLLDENIRSKLLNNNNSQINILIFESKELTLDKDDFLLKENLGVFANNPYEQKVIAGANEYDIDHYPNHWGKRRAIALINKNKINIYLDRFKDDTFLFLN